MQRWVLWVFLLWLVCRQGAIGFSCVCSPSECDEITDEDCPGGGTVWDPCGCCRVCARVEAEPCGGPYGFHGTCGPGLECVVAAAASGKPVLAANSEGICVRTPGSDVRCPDPKPVTGCNMVGHRCKCAQVPACPGEAPFTFETEDECELNLIVMLSHEQSDAPWQETVDNCTAEAAASGLCVISEIDEALCPPDSHLVDPSEGCVCRIHLCARPQCRSGFEPVLRKKGKGVPGDCCDVYECPKEKNCSIELCPKSAEQCPDDSFRLPNHKSINDCCSIPTGCQCFPCQDHKCPEDHEVRVVREGINEPGTCCSLYECLPPETSEGSCLYEGVHHTNGSSWLNDNCTECRCESGNTLCSSFRVLCPPLPDGCIVSQIPSGDCCPVCTEHRPAKADGCMNTERVIIPNGHEWQEQDPCTRCQCRDGRIRCKSYYCKVNCMDPVYIEGECCPVCNNTNTAVPLVEETCPNLENCSLNCYQGYMRDEAGCKICACTSEGCDLQCSQDSNGNKICNCIPLKNSNTSTSSKLYPSASPSPLPTLKCPSLANCKKNCTRGYRINNKGCQVCKCNTCKRLVDCNKRCLYEMATNNKGCPICKCKPNPKKSFEDTSEVYPKTMCISADGELYSEGDSWFDGCRQCVCRQGVELCALLHCPQLNCPWPNFNASSECCPRCAESSTVSHVEHASMVCQSVDGLYRLEGDHWSLDSCTQCTCHQGRVLCEARKCPPVPCQQPLSPKPNECCPSCPETILDDQSKVNDVLEGKSTHLACEGHPNGATWRQDVCVSCKCEEGESQCFREQCPTPQCVSPVFIKNSCCPLCLKPPESKCEKHSDGESWIEECQQCQCRNGVKSCEPRSCPMDISACTRSLKECCPLCSENLPSAPHYYIWIIVFVFAVIMFISLICNYICWRRRAGKCDYKCVVNSLDKTPSSLVTAEKSALAP